MEYENDHSEVVEHHIDELELFHDTYPYERLEAYQLPNLEKESLKFYMEQLKFSENDKTLAYYFFEYRNLSKGVKAVSKQPTNDLRTDINHSHFMISRITLQISISLIACLQQAYH